MLSDMTVVESGQVHEDLRRAAEALGSNRALAKHLGVSEKTLYDWMSFRIQPPLAPQAGWTKRTHAELERKLLKLTGKLLPDLFPRKLHPVERVLNSPDDYRILEPSELARFCAYAEAVAGRLRKNDGNVEYEELKTCLTVAMRRLPSRERKILTLRYGLQQHGGASILAALAFPEDERWQVHGLL